MSTTAQDDAAAMTVAAMINDNSLEINAPTLPPMPQVPVNNNNNNQQHQQANIKKRIKKKCNYVINESTKETCNNIALKDGVCARHGAKKRLCSVENW